MPKLLAQFLHEQQEPFALDVYLVESGYSKGTLLTCPSINASSSGFCYSFLKCSSISRNKRRSHLVPKCSKFVKAVFSRLVLDNHAQKIFSPGRKSKGSKDNISNHDEIDHEDKFSSASSTIVFDSCSESYEESTDILSAEKEDDADIKLKWRAIEDEDSKQLSPVSVLEQNESDKRSPIHYKQYNLKSTKKTSTTISRCNLKQPTQYSSIGELQLDSDSINTQYIINKRVLHQTKRLLVDCVREVIENHRKSDKSTQELHKILGTDELWKLVLENVSLWSQDSIDETNIDRILHHDYLDSVEGWRHDFEEQNDAMSIEIGNTILDHIINEIVTALF